VVKFSRNGVPPPVSGVPPPEIAVLPPKVVVPPPGNDVPLPVSATVFERLTLKAGKSLNFHTLPFFEAP